jgi:outer membrane protein OmpA-like peptidoglycan-associated protein
MKKNQAQEEGGGEKAPLWIISFADMISLLMAFFVMLQTLATEHTNELFTTGRGKFVVTMGEFKRTINGFGMPGLFGDSADNHSFGVPRKQYNFDSPQTEPAINPAANGEEEKLRRLFTSLSRTAKTDRPQLTGKIQGSTFIPIRFTDAGNQLDSDTTSRLTQYVTMLGHTGTADDTVVYYVVGAAPDISSPSEQWVVSEKRARSVADFLRGALPESVRGNVYYWGAGAGGPWFASTDSIKNQNLVLIVSLAPSRR